MVFGNLSANAVLEIDAGDHTVSLCVLGIDEAVSIIDGNITSVWSASG